MHERNTTRDPNCVVARVTNETARPFSFRVEPLAQRHICNPAEVLEIRTSSPRGDTPPEIELQVCDDGFVLWCPPNVDVWDAYGIHPQAGE